MVHLNKKLDLIENYENVWHFRNFNEVFCTTILCGKTSVPLVDLAFLLENLKRLFREKTELGSLEDIS